MMLAVKDKPLQIPDWDYLYIYCKKCRTVVSDFCKEIKGERKPIQKCDYGEMHYYKGVVKIPGEKYARKTIHLGRDYNEAVKKIIDFEKQTKSGVLNNKVEDKKVISNQEVIPTLLIYVLARYVGWLKDENVTKSEKKELSSEHIKDNERGIKCLVQCLKENNHNLNTFQIADLNKYIADEVNTHLENKGFANRTINKYLGYYTSIQKWYNEEYNVNVKNYFERVKRKKLNPKPQAITHQEYEALLKQITPENGIVKYEKGVKPVRSVYRYWTSAGIQLLMQTGLRREEATSLKWDQIKEIDGIQFLLQDDLKVNRIQKRKTEEEKKIKHVPITKSLKLLLDELDAENKYRNTDNYILAPEYKAKKKMPELLSRAFSKYYAQLNTGRKLTLKSLRKAYISQADLFLSKGAIKEITGHTNNQIIETSYIDKTVRTKEFARHFSVFPSEDERNKELEEIRKLSKNKQQKEREV